MEEINHMVQINTVTLIYGVEAYLLELGYINHDANLRNLLNNEDGYVKGIVETVKQEVLGME